MAEHSIYDAVRRRRLSRVVTVGLIAVGGVAAVAGISAVWAHGAAQPSPSGIARAGVWTVQDDACAEPEVRAAVEGALASDVEGPHNALLATPDEVDADDRARQTSAWQALPERDLAFQLCLRLQSELPLP